MYNCSKSSQLFIYLFVVTWDMYFYLLNLLKTSILLRHLFKNEKLKQQQQRWQREWQKSNRFILAKQQLCTCILLFCTFLNHCWKSATWNFLISCTRFMEFVNTAQNFLFLFRNQTFQIQPQTISPRFYKLNEIE